MEIRHVGHGSLERNCPAEFMVVGVITKAARCEGIGWVFANEFGGRGSPKTLRHSGFLNFRIGCFSFGDVTCCGTTLWIMANVRGLRFWCKSRFQTLSEC